MENTKSKNTQTKLNALGIYQIIGGVVGLGLTVWLISSMGPINPATLLVILIALALYGYSIYCGILLLRKNVAALKHSLINQFLQLIGFAFSGFAFTYISGAYFVIGVDFTNSFLFNFNLGISSQWQIVINGDRHPLILNFNLVALFLILFIRRLQSRLKDEETERQISSIGEQIETQSEI